MTPLARAILRDNVLTVDLPEEFVIARAAELAPLVAWVESEACPQHLRDLRANGFPWVDPARNEWSRPRFAALTEALKPLAEAVAPDGHLRASEDAIVEAPSPTPSQLAWVNKARGLLRPGEAATIVSTGYVKESECGSVLTARDELKVTQTLPDGGAISLYLLLPPDVAPPPLPVQFQISITPTEVSP